MTGAGSGGHITPVLAVAHELKIEQPKIDVVYIGHQGDSLADIPVQDKNIDQAFFVRAGKLRRYHGEGLKQLLDVPTLLKNLRDVFWISVGIWQSFWLLKRIKPDAIFIKGGFVGVPVGLSAALLRIPYITHDSDALPGLANRIIAPWARIHAVGLPKEVYSYPPEKTITVGVPLAADFRPIRPKDIHEFRRELGLERFKRVVFVTGGGLGAQRLNNAIVACVPDLMARYADLAVVHLAGRHEEAALRQRYETLLPREEQGRVITRGFITNLYQYSGAADVIITRAGATSIAEFAAQGKACIIVPNPLLAGGHQLKNAKELASRKVVRVVNEKDLQEDPLSLMAPLVELLDHPALAQQLGERLHLMARPDAAHQLAMLLLDLGQVHTNTQAVDHKKKRK